MSAPAYRVLIVDDDPHVVAVLNAALAGGEYETRAVGTGTEGLRAVRELSPHLIILDVGLPDVEGTEVARRLRVGGDATPILMLTALSGEADVVEGLDSGATAYITKPVRPSEVQAWVRSLLRSVVRQSAAPRRAGEMELDVERRTVRWEQEGDEVRLTPVETRLLATLLDAAGDLVPRDELLRRVWDMDFDPGSGVVAVHVSNLRSKLASIGAGHLVETVRGEGYRLASVKP